jgi:hypothetical protein
MNRSVSESTPARTSSDVMSAVVGEVEAALRALERERNTESVSLTGRPCHPVLGHIYGVKLSLSAIAVLQNQSC